MNDNEMEFLEIHKKELIKILEKYSEKVKEVRLYNADTDKVFRQQTYITGSDTTFFIVRYKELLYSVVAIGANVAKIEYIIFNIGR